MYSFFLQYLCLNILTIFIHITLLYLKNLLPRGYIALYFLCITYLTFFEKYWKLQEKSKWNLFQRMRQALNSPGSPGLEQGCQSIPISQICIFSEELHCSFAVKWSHCGTIKISPILSTIISLSILPCLSVGAGTIWFWEYRTRADRLQNCVKRAFSSSGSLHFLLWSSSNIFTRLSARLLT